MTIEEAAKLVQDRMTAAGLVPGLVTVGIDDNTIYVYEHQRIRAKNRGPGEYTLTGTNFKVKHKYVGRVRPANTITPSEPGPSSGQSPPALLDGYQSNFETLLKAAKNGDLVLISAIRKSDRQPVALICATQRNEDDTITPVPFAEMVNGNPFELYEDPTV